MRLREDQLVFYIQWQLYIELHETLFRKMGVLNEV